MPDNCSVLSRPDRQSETAYLVADVGRDRRRYRRHRRAEHWSGYIHKDLLDGRQNARFGRDPLCQRVLRRHRGGALGGHSFILHVSEVEMIDPRLNHCVQATPDYASLYIVAQVPARLSAGLSCVCLVVSAL